MDGPFARFAPAVVAAVAGVGGCFVVAAAGSASATPAAAPVELVGTFRLDGGSCAGGAVSGTYLRMVLPTGNRSGPFLANGDSTCADQTYTPLGPGRDGGLVTGGYQPEPSPAFDAAGNSRAGAITAPAGFFGVAFSASTNPVDPQTGAATAVPRITADGTTLGGDLSAFAASWNNQEFNQGGPKPGGALPGNTAAPTGTYDPASGAFTLEWTSQIEGGPFDKFTGLWHLEGTFVPASGSPAAPPPADPGSGSGAGDGGAGTPGSAGAGGATGSGSATAGSGTIGAGSPTAAGPAPVGQSPGVSPGAGPGNGGNGATGAATDTDEQALASSARTGEGSDDGWEPPPWLVIVLAVIALVGFGSYVRLDRALRRLQPATTSSSPGPAAEPTP